MDYDQSQTPSEAKDHGDHSRAEVNRIPAGQTLYLKPDTHPCSPRPLSFQPLAVAEFDKKIVTPILTPSLGKSEDLYRPGPERPSPEGRLQGVRSLRERSPIRDLSSGQNQKCTMNPDCRSTAKFAPLPRGTSQVKGVNIYPYPEARARSKAWM